MKTGQQYETGENAFHFLFLLIINNAFIFTRS